MDSGTFVADITFQSGEDFTAFIVLTYVPNLPNANVSGSVITDGSITIGAIDSENQQQVITFSGNVF